MPVAEQGGSRRGQLGGGRTSRTLKYRATGYSTIAAAENAVIAAIIGALGDPPTLDGVPLAGLSVEETNVDDHYMATAKFDPLPPLAPQTSVDPSRFTFDFSQETIRAQVALSTAFFGDAPDRGNLINVKKNSNGTHRVEGVDVPSPAFTFGKTVIVPTENVTDSFVQSLGDIHLHTNNGVFAGFPIGEVLFTGCSGSQRSELETELTYRFAQKPNIIEETIGGIEAVTKLGWQYLEPVYADAVLVGNDTLEAELIGFAVHTLFPSGDLSSLPGL